MSATYNLDAKLKDYDDKFQWLFKRMIDMIQKSQRQLSLSDVDDRIKELQTYVRNVDKELERNITQVRKDHVNELQVIDTKINTTNTNINKSEATMTTKLNSTKSDLENKLTTLETTMNRNVDIVKRGLENNLEQSHVDLEKKIFDSRDSLQTDITTQITSIKNEVTNINQGLITTEQIQQMLDQHEAKIYQQLYPIGSLYITESTLPTFLPGQWEDISTTFIDAKLTIGSQGGTCEGDNTITLTQDQLPSHSHYINLNTTTNGNHNHGIFSIYDDQSYDHPATATQNMSIPDDGTNRRNRTTYTNMGGNHIHNISGNSSATGNGRSIDISGKRYYVKLYKRVA